MSKNSEDASGLEDCDFTVVELADTNLPHYLAYYGHLRAYVEHEDELINTRLTWSLTIHGFLFAIYGLILSKVSEVFVELHKVPQRDFELLVHMISGLLLFQLPICFLGTSIGNGSHRAISAAHQALQHLRAIAHDGGILTHTEPTAPDLESPFVRLPKIAGGGVKSELKVVGARRYYLDLPRWIMLIWASLGVASFSLGIITIFFQTWFFRLLNR